MDINEVMRIAKVLKVDHFDISYVETMSIQGDAMNHIIYNDNKCEINVKKKLLETEKINCVIHELLHLVNRDAVNIATENLEGVARDYYIRFEERANEHMAKVIYNMMNPKEEESIGSALLRMRKAGVI